MYISAHSAEVILSDFRPLKLQSDALQFLNLLLDDILANILTSARSILTDRLKSGLLKTLPTTTGKDALLEAEMELHAYWQRPNAIKPSAAQTPSSEHSFSVPLMIELMRLKCEAYSTLNDSDEDAQAENKIQERLQSQGVEPPKSIVVAPAALYLTAILECICEHILSSVGRVATRDSSKEVAGTHDLFVALCEDDGIYPTFKVSKVYGLIESSLKFSSKPRRSKSLSRAERYEARDTTTPSQLQPQLSLESTTSGPISGSVSPESHPPRSSLDKGKAIKSFRASSDRDMALPSDPVFRVTLSRKSLVSQRDGKDGAGVEAENEGCPIQDFDDLMRSGDTMKVSLTPDRLRSMEAAKQQQRRTATQQTPKTVVNDHHQESPASEVDGRASGSPEPKYHLAGKSSLPHVASIIEDEEPKENAHSTQDARSRPEGAKLPDPRARSVSTSRIYQGSGPRVIRKSSLGIKSTQPQSGLPGRDMYDWRRNPSATPQGIRKTRHKRGSRDIGDVTNGSGEGDESNPEPGDAQGRGRLYPVSKAMNELISFLEDGPPPEIQPVRSATESAASLAPTTKSAKSASRLQRMISKFNLTKDDRVLQDASRGRGIGIRSAPSTPISSSLRSHNPLPVPIAMMPVPPPIPQLAPISPPSSRTSSAEDDSRSLTSRTDLPRKMSVRKAVPTWESVVDRGLQTPHNGGEKTLPPSPPSSSPPASVSSPSPSQSTPTPASEGKDTNGVTHDDNKVLRSETPAATPTTPPAGTGAQEITHPRSSRRNIRSSSNDEQPYSARRSSGRRPQPPNGAVDNNQPIHPSSSLSEALALDLRRLMSQATTADECRLLVDTFLARVGIVPPSDLSPAVDNTHPNADAERLEQTLVNYFLGADLDGLPFPQTQSVQAEAEMECHSTSSTPKQAQAGDSAHLSTATLIGSAGAVHTHHIVSNAVAVVS
ncbi:hypothetical protein EI94DRAFT_1783555 [Lactarius quietus]|nr:hypothetical protein EI94DRAFT_1783555 [Lactarius quietus]